MQEKRLVEELLGAISTMQAGGGTNLAVQESLDNVRAMLAREDRGWQVFKGGSSDVEKGLTLADLKEWSGKLREGVVGAPRLKRAFSLRHGFIWKGGMRYDGISKETRGAKNPRVQEKIDDPFNQRTFFGKQARRRRELSLYADGIALWIGDDVTKRLTPVPLEQITGYLSDPDFPGVIWAYRREWTHRKDDGTTEPMRRWYFVDHFKDESPDSITVKGEAEDQKVDTGMTAFDMHANSFDGWPFGVPDALAAWVWDQIARDLFMDGIDVSSAMATLAFKVNTASNAGGRNAAMQMATAQGAGGTAIMGAGTDLSVLSSAGKGYDFSSISEVVALVASALDVSSIHLTANPGDAGASYGSAAALDEPGRLTMSTRRDEHIDLDERVLRWMGAKEAKAYFQPYDDGTEMYRNLQAVTLPWLQGVLTDDKYKELAAGVLGVPDLGTTPDGVLIPNNIASMARKDIDKDGHATGSTGSPTQGRSSGLGDADGAPRDTRDDTIS